MLAKRYRLTKRGSFAYVYRKGKAVRSAHMTMIFAQGRDVARIGLSVSNKVGHAVVRNLLKRRMRAVLRENITRLSPCQAVIAAKPEAAALDFLTIKAEIESLLSKSGLIKPNENQEKN